MTCPKINNCEIEQIYKIVMEDLTDVDKYSALADSLPLIRDELCGNDDSYRKCPLLLKDSLSSQWPDDSALITEKERGK